MLTKAKSNSHATQVPNLHEGSLCSNMVECVICYPVESCCSDSDKS